MKTVASWIPLNLLSQKSRVEQFDISEAVVGAGTLVATLPSFSFIAGIGLVGVCLVGTAYFFSTYQSLPVEIPKKQKINIGDIQFKPIENLSGEEFADRFLEKCVNPFEDFLYETATVRSLLKSFLYDAYRGQDIYLFKGLAPYQLEVIQVSLKNVLTVAENRGAFEFVEAVASFFNG